jgi:hypothetical protein
VADETKVIDVISRLLHPSVAGVLAAFLPGLFFETCVLLASPRILQLMVARTSFLNRYTPVFVALLVAFVVGSAFMLWVQLIQNVLRLSAKAWAGLRLWDRMLTWLRQRASTRYPERKAASGQVVLAPSRYHRFIDRLEGRRMHQDIEWIHARDAWQQVALVLLKRYGIEDPRHLQAWTNVLGTLSVQDLRGYTLVTALHATGWSGLAAAYFASELRGLPFESLCLFLIFCGLIHAATLASWSTHLLRSWLMGLGNTWDELKEAGVSKGAEAGSDPV